MANYFKPILQVMLAFNFSGCQNKTSNYTDTAGLSFCEDEPYYDGYENGGIWEANEEGTCLENICQTVEQEFIGKYGVSITHSDENNDCVIDELDGVCEQEYCSNPRPFKAQVLGIFQGRDGYVISEGNSTIVYAKKDGDSVELFRVDNCFFNYADLTHGNYYFGLCESEPIEEWPGSEGFTYLRLQTQISTEISFEDNQNQVQSNIWGVIPNSNQEYSGRGELTIPIGAGDQILIGFHE